MLAAFLRKHQFSPFIGVEPRPRLNHRQESSIKGLFIAGDLAAAPSIALSFWQGYRLGQQLKECTRPDARTNDYDICIVGAGPAGIGVALALQNSELRYLLLEKNRPFSTIERFPPEKWIFAEPKTIGLPDDFWFSDAPTAELLERWTNELAQRNLPIRGNCPITRIQKTSGRFTLSSPQEQISAGKVVLAIGKRAWPRRLGIAGEDQPHIHIQPQDPASYVGQKTLVVGGGDAAVESALMLANAGIDTTLAYRGPALTRPTPRNQSRLSEAVQNRQLRLMLNSTPTRFEKKEVYFSESRAEEFDSVIVQIGSESSAELSERFGIEIETQTTARYALLTGVFALLIYLFYLLKSGLDRVCTESIEQLCTAELSLAKRALYPFSAESSWASLPSLLELDLGFRIVDGAFWGTVVYSALITIFGLRALLKYRSRVQRQRYLSLIGFQLLFLFGIPEIIAPFLISSTEQGFWFQLFGGERGWKFYALSVPWPLNIWALIDAPAWTQNDSATTALSWILAAALVSFVAIPLYVRKYGQRFCSYLCGCGGLAETVGDLFRELAPRGTLSKQLEATGRWIFLLAIPVTMLILVDAWNLLSLDVLRSTKAFAQHWYTLMVDFWLASVLGVALYPVLGNRIWCRYFCPLRAYMEVLSRRFSRVAITANEKCIRCGECTRQCQMGIQVEQFAVRQEALSNLNSACIQCGICIEVCPINVLSIGEEGEPISLNWTEMITPPRARWE